MTAHRGQTLGNLKEDAHSNNRYLGMTAETS